ncbi:MAG TPA: hypothetical protein VFF60_07850 [Candidatus Binatus sp.]|nr:hypothetical protein [Candidatus Binatus sp.]
MIHWIGIGFVIVALLVIVAIVVSAALQFRAVARAAAKLRSHPLFESDWRAAQALKVQRVRDGSEQLRNDLARLGPALASLALALYELGALAYRPSPSIERVMRHGIPWLSGLLRPRPQQR